MVKAPRFVAGAVCPACDALDRIVVEEIDDGRRRRCVACGFVEDEPTVQPGMLKGRLDKPTRRDAAVTAVRIVEPGSGLDKTESDKSGSDKSASDRPASDRSGSDTPTSDKSSSDNSSSDKTGSDSQ